MKAFSTAILVIAVVSPQISLADVSRECRGVAAGVVSAMKANDEISNAEMMSAAVKAARRACAAALEGFSDEELADAMDSDDEAREVDDKESVWEFLSQDHKKKDGHKRLDRLKN